jgi:hypothetical protein
LPIKCLIDGTEFESEKFFYLYLRKLKVKISDYFETYYPRVDKHTGEKIPYKDKSTYFDTDFLNKNNLKAFCKEKQEEGLEWGVEFLKKRKERKSATRAFHHVELRTLLSPSVLFFEKHGDYKQICQDIGFESVLNYKDFQYEFKSARDFTIRCDTREQKLIKFVNKNHVDTIKYGDYCVEEPYHRGVFIEKKSIGDFAHSFGKDKDRLGREFDRCKANGDYMVVLVQKNLTKALSFNYLFEMKHSKVSPEYVFGNVRNFLLQYDNLQFLFIDEKDSERVCLEIFRMGKFARAQDLQYMYDIKAL